MMKSRMPAAQTRHPQGVHALAQFRGKSGFASNAFERVTEGGFGVLLNYSPRVAQQKTRMAYRDARPQLVPQRYSSEAIRSSPRIVAQRRQWDSLFGAAVQRKRKEEPHGNLVATQRRRQQEESLQRKAVGDSAEQAPDIFPDHKQPGVPENLKSGMESPTGISVENVWSHQERAPDKVSTDALEMASPGERKRAAYRWLAAEMASGAVDARELNSLLERAQEQFRLSSVKVAGADMSDLRIGFFASPGEWFSLPFNKLVGNNLSDFAIGLGGRFLGMARGTVLTSSGKVEPLWGPLTGRGFGTFMQVNGLNSGNKPQGSDTDSEKLKASNEAYKSLIMRRQAVGGASYYVAGHLLRGKLGGPGDEWKNLAPITQPANNPSAASHLNQVEDNVLNLVIARETVTYRVQAIYGRWPWEWPRYFGNIVRYGWTPELNEVMAAEDHIPTAFSCQWWVQDGAGSWIPYGRHIRQWRFSNGESYIIRTAHGDVDYGNSLHAWDVLQLPVKLAIGMALWSAFPLLPAFLASPHLLRGLAAEAVIDLLGRGADFLLTEEGGTRVAAYRSDIGLLIGLSSLGLATGASFGLPQMTLLDPLLIMVMGDAAEQSQLMWNTGYGLETIISMLKEGVLAIPGFKYLSEHLPELERLRQLGLGTVDLAGTNPSVAHRIAVKIGGSLITRCTAKTTKETRCKNNICAASRLDGSNLCNVHHKQQDDD